MTPSLRSDLPTREATLTGDGPTHINSKPIDDAGAMGSTDAGELGNRGWIGASRPNKVRS